MSDVRSIGDLIESLIDYRGKTPPKSDSGVPLITAKVIKGGVILNEPREYIADEIFDSWMRRGLPRTGDILITTEAPLGEVAQVGADARIALAQRVILLRPDRAAVDPQFLFHYLRSPVARAALLRRAGGTTVSGIRQPELKAVEVRLLPRSSQEIVGRVLDAIDDLIENNRRRVQVLEEMARTIYREWFVHFRYPGRESDTFVNPSSGVIPDRWTVNSLGEVADLDRTSIQPGRSPDESFDHYSIPAFDDEQLPALDAGSTIKSGKFLVSSPAVLASKLNPRIERNWLVEPGAIRRSVASTEFLVLRPGNLATLEWLYLTIGSESFQKRLKELSGGTSTSHQRAKPDDFLAIERYYPRQP